MMDRADVLLSKTGLLLLLELASGVGASRVLKRSRSSRFVVGHAAFKWSAGR